MKTKTDISIVLCTYNRAPQLATTLDALAKLETAAGLSYEILVVDNNSNDETRKVTEAAMTAHPGLIRYIFETRQGLSWARNRGIQEAHGEIIAFTDDDVVVDPGWLSAMALASVAYPDYSGFGGRVLPEWRFTPPWWFVGTGMFHMLKSGVVAGHDLGDSPIEYREGMYFPIGGNMWFRRKVFERCGLFRTDLGKSGKKAFFGEDSDFFGRLLRAGEKFIYIPDAVIYHIVDRDKMTRHYFTVSYFNIGRSIGRRDDFPEDAVRYLGVPRYLVRMLLPRVGWGVVAIATGQYKKALFYWLETCWFLGQIYETLRIPFIGNGRGAWILRRPFETVVCRVMGTITHVESQEPVVALTFDDGPHPEFTPRLLDILKRHGARATFFMVGERAKKYPNLVKRVAEAGHVIGNHSWDHASFPLLSGRERREQIRACARALAPYGQKLFRPPYGHQSLSSRLDALWLGNRVIAWSVSAEDWLGHDADLIVQRLADQMRPGNIILLHDALHAFSDQKFITREPTLQAVEMLLERFGGRFRFVSVPELLRFGRPQRRNWLSKPDPKRLNQFQTEQGEARRYAG
ncbi:MAG: glycosyltransferase [Nitrospirae bacterium]|nr:glycosyltransferase [Nitrospirota bacterium]